MKTRGGRFSKKTAMNGTVGLLEIAGTPNQPAAPNAGIASRLTIGHQCPGVGDPERSANIRTLLSKLFFSFALYSERSRHDRRQIDERYP
jgi:hypothetical protein